jgi:formylglycine-generating enzyme required for sulfatase activity
VTVPGADVTLGFAAGVLRAQKEIDSFRLTKHPITVGDYRACVAAGACEEPRATCDGAAGLLTGPTYKAATANDVPVTCVRPTEAQSYCAWVGGRLPKASEWLLGVRGPSVQKYAWGDAAATCARHPKAEGILADERSCCGDTAACTVNDLARVATHPAGASPSGVEDALFARGELVDSDDDAPLASCGEGACLIVGRGAAIEGLIPAPADGGVASTFRCVLNGGGR